MADYRQGRDQHNRGERHAQHTHHRGGQEGHPFRDNQYTEGNRSGDHRDRHPHYNWDETGDSYINQNDRREAQHEDDYLNSYRDDDRRQDSRERDDRQRNNRQDDNRQSDGRRRDMQGHEWYGNQYARGRREDYSDRQQHDDSRGMYGHTQESSFDGGRRRFGYDNTFRNYDTGYDANDGRGYAADDDTSYENNRYDGRDGRNGHRQDRRRDNGNRRY